MQESVCDIIRRAEINYLQATTKIGRYVQWSMHDTIETIDAYLNSKHISGSTDSLGREKPFFNIVSSAVNIWYRATDIDRKDIRILPDKVENTALAFIATVHLQEWMKKSRFGVFLNQWGRALARYGSAVVKFVDRDGELIPTVIPWNRFIADPIDFNSIPRIEKFYKTPAQLRKIKEYDQDVVSALIDAITTRKTLDKQQQDIELDFIELYEVHGELDERLLEKEPDMSIDQKDIVYREQMHVLSYLSDGEGEYLDFCLYKGKEKRDPYMITHLIEEDGRTLSIGAVEYLFDAQWMRNHTVKNMKDTLDIASKLVFQTADSRYVGRNVLSAIETGDIFIHEVNMPLTRVANDKPDIVALQNFGSMWDNLSRELTSTPESMRGINPPANQPWSTTGTLLQQGNSLFEMMTESKGLAIEDMMREFVIPFLKTQMDTKDEIVATLTSEQIADIDAMYVPVEAVKRFNRKAVEQTIQHLETGDPQSAPSPYQPQLAQQAVKDQMAMLGNKRSFKPDELDQATWDTVLGDFEWKCNVEVTNEDTNKQAVMQTLNTVFQTIASNPYILQNPNAKMVFDAILTETGRLSPLQLAQVNGPSARMPNARLNETIDFKDLPPDAKVQMLNLAGIHTQPPAPAAAPPAPAV